MNAEEASAALANLMAALTNYNDSVDAGRDPADLASPSADACKYCDFAPQCPAFWEAADANWAVSGLVAVAGEVTHTTVAQDGGMAIQLLVEAGTEESKTFTISPIDPVRYPGLSDIAEGSPLAAVQLHKRGVDSAKPRGSTALAWSPADDA